MDSSREVEAYGNRLMVCDVQQEGWRAIPLGLGGSCSSAMVPS